MEKDVNNYLTGVAVETQTAIRPSLQAEKLFQGRAKIELIGNDLSKFYISKKA